MYFLFDGSYAGFMCCVFESFERKEFDIIPITEEEYQGDIFQSARMIFTDAAKARRVHVALQKKLNKEDTANFLRVILSEEPRAWLSSFRIILEIFKDGASVLNNYGNEDVLCFTQTLKKVNRESHRMKAFVRFKKSSDGMYYSLIEPDFNVLPLIAEFFKDRYADQRWLIYDVKRKYGMLYDMFSVSEVKELLPAGDDLPVENITITLDKEEEKYQRLWQQYYKSTNITTRKNMKLHLQHVPRRYWKYLSEKETGFV